MAAKKNPRATRDAEPAARRGAAAAMSAPLLSEAAPPRRAAPAALPSHEDAFDAWLRRELGRLYDATLAEPVPAALTRLLHMPPRTDTRRR